MLLAFGACSSAGSSKAPPTDPPAFVAAQGDFASFRSWPSLDPGPGVAPGNDHLTGPRIVYYNRSPPLGAKAFPVGTIIVKESGDGDFATRDIFAMVKRGGDFNEGDGGAVDWEWFRLQSSADGQTNIIVWRGIGPADGDAYGSNGSTGGCNPCHATVRTPDFVFPSVLTTPLAP